MHACVPCICISCMFQPIAVDSCVDVCTRIQGSHQKINKERYTSMNQVSYVAEHYFLIYLFTFYCYTKIILVLVYGCKILCSPKSVEA